MDVEAFATMVGADGPVRVVGGRTSWSVGGTAPDGVREVRAPAGIAGIEPSEMIVRVGAGTPVRELQDAVAEHGQYVNLPVVAGSTVGGALSVGRGDVRRLSRGPVRDGLLEARYVDAWGRPTRTGAPVVKNVSGFDLCRLLVGSLGTLGLLAEVVLRTRPTPQVERWVAGPADPRAVWAALRRPGAVLWDGGEVHVLLEGHPDDVEDAAVTLAALGCGPADGPPALPPVRASRPPSTLWDLRTELGDARFVAELGVGVVHLDAPLERPRPADRLVALHRAVKARLDPMGRLNPGRSPLAAAGGR